MSVITEKNEVLQNEWDRVEWDRADRSTVPFFGFSMKGDLQDETGGNSRSYERAG